MGHSTIVLLASLALVAMVLVFTVLHWRRMRSLRVALQGVGVALFLAGLYVLGFMDLVYSWVRDTWRWIVHTSFHGTHMTGLVIGGAGVLLFVLGLLVSPVSRAEARQRRQVRQQRPAQVGDVSARRRPGRTAASPAATGRGGRAVDPEDAEIEALLRGHGIE